MRIAYLAGYQGPDLIKRRRMKSNIALAGSQKIRLVAALLAASGHEVSIFSPGIAAERSGKWHGGFNSVLESGSPVAVRYSGTIDLPVASQLAAVPGLWRKLSNTHGRRPFGALLLYNFGLAETAVAAAAVRHLNLPLVLEYEDDTDILPDGRRTWRNAVWRWLRFRLQQDVRAVLAASPELLDQYSVEHRLLLRGVISHDMEVLRNAPRRELGASARLLFAGTLQHSKGIDQLCTTIDENAQKRWDLHVVGDGPMRSYLEIRYAGSGIRFHGFVSRSQLVDQLSRARVCINPHRAGTVKIGNVFPFKIVEYLAAGCPVVSTRMGYIEPEMEAAICYADSESPSHLSEAIKRVLEDYPKWVDRAAQAQRYVWEAYGYDAVKVKLNRLITDATSDTLG